MKLDKVYDPRGFLEKYTRKELEYLAILEGRDDIKPEWPAPLMRQRFADSPPKNWPIPIRTNLGVNAQVLRIPPFETWKHTQFAQAAPLAVPNHPEPEQKVAEVDATADLKRQWEEQSAPKKKTPKIIALRQACKQRGIKFARTDKMIDLEAKLNGENTSPGSQ